MKLATFIKWALLGFAFLAAILLYALLLALGELYYGVRRRVRG